MWLAFVGFAFAHEYSTIVLGPTSNWCDDLAAQAQPADVVQLLPGTYPGGCEISLGGLIELNESLLVTRYGNGPVVIRADASGVSIRITGEPTRLFDLELEGRVVVEADGATLDSCMVEGIDVAPDVERINVLWSEVHDDVLFDLDNTVFRGNRTASVTIAANSGLVADNTIRGDASSSAPFERNLVIGDLLTTSDAFANVVVGHVDADGRLYGNTLLGEVSAADARNNLTLAAALDPANGNLRCPECMADPEVLDVRPIGAALDAALVDAPEDDRDFCNTGRSVVGAMDPNADLDGEWWTAYDRIREGCVPGVEGSQEPLPEPEPEPEPTPEPEPQPPVVEPETDVVEPRGCTTRPGPPALLLAALPLLLLWRRP